jgi:hypothetical protein
VRDHVLHPYSITGKITISYILIFMFLDIDGKTKVLYWWMLQDYSTDINTFCTKNCRKTTFCHASVQYNPHFIWSLFPCKRLIVKKLVHV